ncbi:uncharacterized protein LOC131235224 [Magnolia sinica]|uniref:uncharacterized protein LOC131235224 n=1 Tax=Magnolia sinica TaxID=86752 RepID=UPI00265B4112|nr:uncharacterized protein LOC131235224 [Magnolia sinica]
MGNATSCAPLASTGPVKVLTLDGTLEEYIRPINAGDLMLDNPRQFVCDSIDLKVGHLVPGLTADEELEPRQLYFLLPIHMLYSVLTHEEMFSLTHKASKALKQSRSKNIGRIFPVLGDFCIFNSQIKPLKGSAREPNTILRVSRQGSWRPALDTIIESPSTLR